MNKLTKSQFASYKNYKHEQVQIELNCSSNLDALNLNALKCFKFDLIVVIDAIWSVHCWCWWNFTLATT